MTTRIDWLSLSFKGGTVPPNFGARVEMLATWLDCTPQDLMPRHHVPGRAPYNRCEGYRPVTIYWHTHKDGLLAEFSGAQLDVIGQDVARELLAGDGKVTRLDLAVDYTNPVDFDLLPAPRTGGRMQSASGITHYYGSPKSDIMTRVYRYEPPHPRAGLTRVEHVYRRDAARRAAQAVLSGDAGALHRGRSAALGLALAIPLDGPTARLTPAQAREKSALKTVTWLQKQVAPALRALEASGMSRDELLALLFADGAV